MRAMRRRVFKNDIAAWSSSFLGALARSRQQRDAGSQRAERAAADA
jgi:trehalose-6-phosphate synthase